MKKTIIIFWTLIFIFAGCGNDDPNKIENQIAKYKQQIAEINKKIKDLEAKLKKDTLPSNDIILVDTMKIRQINYTHYTEVSGSAIADKDIFITPEMNGQIKKIYVTEGQFVKKGQLLVKLKDDLLRSNLAQLETQFMFADTLYQKQKQLYEKNVISEAQYLQSKSQRDALEKNIEAIKTQLAMTNIYAPFAGVVDQIFAKEGQMAAPNVRILELVNLNSLYAEAFVSEKYLPALKTGDNVIITFQLYPDIELKSKISWISNVIDPASRTIKIKAKIPNNDKKIKPNMTLILKFADYKKDKVIVIPTALLTKDINGWYVYKAVKKNNEFVARKQYVKIGISDRNKTVIEEGLTTEDIIITKGGTLIRDGSKIILK